MTEVVNVPPARLAMMEGSPAWPKLAALTHTLPYDIALTSEPGIPPWVSAIAVPVLVLGGGTSPDWFGRTVRDTAAAIPGASLVLADGYDHNVPSEVLAPILTEFFLG